MKLASCPFCNEKPTIVHWGIDPDRFSIGCRNKRCLARPIIGYELIGERKAIKAWNTRTDDKEER